MHLTTTALGVLVLLPFVHLSSGCGGRGVVDRAADDGSAGPAPTPAPTSTSPPPSCALDPGLPAGASVVACGFPPHVTLLGGDASAVYTLTEAGAFFRVDKASGAKTLLYTAPPSPPGGRPVFALGLGDDGAVAGGAVLSFTLGAGVWSLEPTRASRPVQVLGDVFENAPIVDPTSMYFLRAKSGPGYIQYVDVERVPLAGGPATVLDPTYDQPVAVAGDSLYVATEVDGAYVDPPYPHLLRVPITGGATSEVLSKLDTSGVPGSIAADAEAVYVIGSSQTSGVQVSHPITRFPLDGGASTTLAIVGPIDPEIPGPLPWGLRLDEGFVYFLGTAGQVSAFGASSVLYRVPNAAPSSMPESVVTATSMGPPVFDTGFLYVAMQRGGTSGPIEGTVLRVPKRAPQ